MQNPAGAGFFHGGTGKIRACILSKSASSPALPPSFS